MIIKCFLCLHYTHLNSTSFSEKWKELNQVLSSHALEEQTCLQSVGAGRKGAHDGVSLLQPELGPGAE